MSHHSRRFCAQCLASDEHFLPFPRFIIAVMLLAIYSGSHNVVILLVVRFFCSLSIIDFPQRQRSEVQAAASQRRVRQLRAWSTVGHYGPIGSRQKQFAKRSLRLQVRTEFQFNMAIASGAIFVKSADRRSLDLISRHTQMFSCFESHRSKLLCHSKLLIAFRAQNYDCHHHVAICFFIVGGYVMVMMTKIC